MQQSDIHFRFVRPDKRMEPLASVELVNRQTLGGILSSFETQVRSENRLTYSCES